MKIFSKFFLAFSFIALVPMVALAATTDPCSSLTGFSNIICKAQGLLNSLLPLLLALGVVYFVWGVVQYVIGDSDEAKTKGRDKIIYGIIGLAVIVGLWGLVAIVVNTFNLGGAVPPEINNLVSVPTSSTCDLGTSPKFQNVLNYFTCIINDSVIPLLFAVAVVAFIWGAVKFFIINSDEEAKREQGKQFMLWGIVAIAVMLSVWGLVGVLRSTFGLNGSVLPQVKP